MKLKLYKDCLRSLTSASIFLIQPLKQVWGYAEQRSLSPNRILTGSKGILSRITEARMFIKPYFPISNFSFLTWSYGLSWWQLFYHSIKKVEVNPIFLKPQIDNCLSSYKSCFKIFSVWIQIYFKKYIFLNPFLL